MAKKNVKVAEAVEAKVEKKAKKPLSPSQAIAKSIADGIKDKKIIMGPAQKVVGQDGLGNKLSGMYFVSEKLPTGAIIEVRKQENEGKKNTQTTIKLTAGGTIQVFSGGAARLAYRLLTKTPRLSSFTEQNLKFCEEHLNFLGTEGLED
jgi:hypothetical protein